MTKKTEPLKPRTWKVYQRVAQTLVYRVEAEAAAKSRKLVEAARAALRAEGRRK
jgi:hypothetical protein